MRQPLTNADFTRLIGSKIQGVEVFQHPFGGIVQFIRYEGDFVMAFWTQELRDDDGQVTQVKSLTQLYGQDVDTAPPPAPVTRQVPTQQPVQPPVYQPTAPQTYQPNQVYTQDADPYSEYWNFLAGSGLTPAQVAAIQDYPRRNAPQGAQVQATVPPDIYDPSFLTRMGLAPR